MLTLWLSRRGGGVPEAVRGLGAGLLGRGGAEVRVFGIEDASLAADLPDWRGLPLTALPTAGAAAFGYAPGMVRALGAAALDVLHVHGLWSYASIAAPRWAAAAGRPYVVAPHGMLDAWALANSRWKKRLFALLVENRHLRRADCLLALCESEARAIRAFGLRNPICIVPNGIDEPPPAASDRPWPFPGIEPGAPVLFSLGRLHPKKNLLALVEAWREVRRRAVPGARDWHLVIAGWDQGGYRDRLVATCDGRPERHNIHIPGPLFGADKAAALGASTAFVLPSLSEGLPVVVLEAWAHGLPVLMTDACNLPEGFAAGAALKIGTDTPDVGRGLADLMAMSPSARAAVGQAGLALVRHRFTWDRVAQETAGVYRWLGGSGPVPASLYAD